MERLLVTGIDGPLGANLGLALADRCEVLGLSTTATLACSALAIAHWESADRTALAEVFEGFQPQWVLHASPLAAGSWDQPMAGTADAIAVVTDLAELARRGGARLTVLSSDVVFAGPRMFHEEPWPTSSPAPRAGAVRALERAAEERCALVVRTHAYGWSPVPSAACFAERAYRALATAAVTHADGRRHATPILATDLAELLWRSHELKLQGLYHLAGAERVSAFRFVCELAAACGLQAPAAEVVAPQPPSSAWHDETSLNSRRARRALELSTPLVREGLDRFAAQGADGWFDAFQLAGQTRVRREIAA